MVVAVLAIGVLGLLVGSFLNVVIYRVPAGLSIVAPPSACPHCGARIRPYDNIPVVSWLLLRGRCRDCGEPISPRYPLVELGTGGLFAVVAWVFVPPVLEAVSTGSTGGGGGVVGAVSTGSTSEGGVAVAAVVQLVAFLYLAAISVALALIDLDAHRLPNAIVLPGYLVGIVLLGTAGLLTNSWDALVTAGVGMVGYFAVHLLLAVVWTGGMGMGDVKLAGVLGLFLGWLGWPALVVGLLAGFILGGLFGVILLATGRGRKTRIAYGPWMLLGAWAGILLGTPLTTWYLGLFGLG